MLSLQLSIFFQDKDILYATSQIAADFFQYIKAYPRSPVMCQVTERGDGYASIFCQLVLRNTLFIQNLPKEYLDHFNNTSFSDKIFTVFEIGVL